MTQILRFRSIRSSVVLAGASLVLMPALASAQVSVAVPLNWGAYYGPGTAFSSEVFAEAAWLQAYGRMEVDLASAREIRARAVRAEIANSVEYLKAVWEKRSIREAELLKRYVSPLKRKQIADSQTWARMKDNPELNRNAIGEGTALNFLLNRLSGTVLAHQFSFGNERQISLADSADGDRIQAQLVLSPTTLHSLQLRQDRPNGQRLIFRADEGVALKVDEWPYLLNDDEFKNEREAFERARANVVNEAAESKRVKNATLKTLLVAHNDLSTAFEVRYDKQRRHSSTNMMRHYFTSQRFLKALAGEIARLEATGAVNAFDGSLKFEGDNLLALLTHMSRSGLDFSRAKPGEEAAYDEVFHLMRDLYITVADDDPQVNSLPKKTTQQP